MELTSKDVHFVTRLKNNASYAVLETRYAEGTGVIADEISVFAQRATDDNEDFSRLVGICY